MHKRQHIAGIQPGSVLRTQTEIMCDVKGSWGKHERCKAVLVSKTLCALRKRVGADTVSNAGGMNDGDRALLRCR